MTKRERIVRMLNLQQVDRVPLLGGFFVSGKHYRGVTGISEEEFRKEPAKHAISAYRELDVDGLILLRLPSEHSGHLEYRNMTRESFHSYKHRFSSPEDVLAYVEFQF